jgi:hypothetical protein
MMSVPGLCVLRQFDIGIDMEVKLNAPRAGRKDPIECASYEAVRASAYGAGFRAGENTAAARSDAKAEVFRREMAAVLIELGNAIGAGDKAAMIDWYGAVSKVFACGGE